MLDEFKELWNHPNTYSYNEFIGAYSCLLYTSDAADEL